MHDLLRVWHVHAAQFFGAERLLVEGDGLVAVADVELGSDGVEAFRYGSHD
jgi:hypothetical protein